MSKIGLFVELKAVGETAEEKREGLRQKILAVLLEMKKNGIAFGAGAECGGTVVCSSMLINPFITVIFDKENKTAMEKMIAVFITIR